MTPRPLARPASRGRPSHTLARRGRLRWLFAVLFSVLLGVSSAAEEIASEAAALLDEARAAVIEAYGRDDPRTPDHPGWREGLELGRQALAIDPHPDIHRFLGRTYAIVGWSVRALTHFDALLAEGGSLEDPEGTALAEVSSSDLYGATAANIGFARYGVGDLDGALVYYGRWLDAVPGSVSALRWLGRIHLERLDPEAALPFWERVVELEPDDEAAAFYLEEARRGAAVGAEASAAYRSGLTAYQAGDLPAALASFEVAVAAAPGFVDASVWAGRTALEVQRPDLAVRHWERVVAARPDDGGATYFLRVAQDQAAYGVAAGSRFHAGIEAYERGDRDGAGAAFAAAVAANGDFVEAWVWLARVHQELGRYDDAVEAWERVLVLDPRDERARYFLNVTRQQRGVTAAAGAVFADGIAAFEANDLATAGMRFTEAVRIDPDALQAWVWLGRVAFSLQRWEAAAVAYRRAAELAPDDDDIAFFAEEAERLANPEPEVLEEEVPEEEVPEEEVPEEEVQEEESASGDPGEPEGVGDEPAAPAEVPDLRSTEPGEDLR